MNRIIYFTLLALGLSSLEWSGAEETTRKETMPEQMLRGIKHGVDAGRYGDVVEAAEELFRIDPTGEDPSTALCYEVVGEAAIRLSETLKQKDQLDLALGVARLSAFCHAMASDLDMKRLTGSAESYKAIYQNNWTRFKPPAGFRDPSVDKKAHPAKP